MPELSKIFSSLIFLVLFYSIIGLMLFEGIFEYRCRVSSEPPENGDEWLVAYDYNLQLQLDERDIPELSYGLDNFDNIYNSALTSF